MDDVIAKFKALRLKNCASNLGMIMEQRSRPICRSQNGEIFLTVQLLPQRLLIVSFTTQKSLFWKGKAIERDKKSSKNIIYQ